jgi:glycine reductase
VIVPAVRRNRLADRCAAERAVDLLLARLRGDRDATEIPVTGFGSVRPAPPVADPASATVVLVTEGALVPGGNPDRLESARARGWRRYSLAGRDRLTAGEFESVHGGFSTVLANADPHRILPLDAARELEAEGRIGRLHDEYLVTAGNGTHVGAAAAFGVEWAAELRRAGVQAAILTAT